MGCAMSAVDEADKKRSDEIDRTLAAEGMNRNNEIKLLLLGEWNLLPRLANTVTDRIV